MTTEVGVFNLILQGGAFGLLCWIAVYWLPRAASHLAASYGEAVASFREQEREQRRDHVTALMTALQTFQTEQKYEREQCADQFATLMEALNRNQEIVRNGQAAVHQALSQITRQVDVHHAFSQKAVDTIKDMATPSNTDRASKRDDGGGT